MAFNTAPGRAEYTASAAQTKFTFPFKIFDTSDVKVYLTPAGQTPDDTVDILIETTDYTITINGDDGGDVDLTSGASINDSITLVRELPTTRTTEYQQSGDLTAEALNEDQDYQTYLILDGATVSERALTVPDSVQSFDTEIPSPVANKLLLLNAFANGFDLLDPASTSFFKDSFIVDNIAALSGVDPNVYNSVIVRGYYVANDGGGGLFNYDIAQAAVDNGGTIINGWIRQYEGAVNAKWFGASKDGILDSTAELQSAIDFITSIGGGSLFVPKGLYRTRNLETKPLVSIHGEDKGSTKFRFFPTTEAADVDAYCLIWQNSNTTLRGITFDGQNPNLGGNPSSVGNGVVIKIDSSGYHRYMSDCLIAQFAGYVASPAGGTYGINANYSADDIRDPLDGYSHNLQGGNGLVTDGAGSNLNITDVKIDHCDGYGFDQSFGTDSEYTHMYISNCCRGGLYAGRNNSNNRYAFMKISGCRKLSLTYGGVATDPIVVPYTDITTDNSAAFHLGGRRHTVVSIEAQENGSNGFMLGSYSVPLIETQLIGILADGNGGFDPDNITTVDDRDGVIFNNYYDLTVTMVADDFRAPRGLGRQKRGFFVQDPSGLQYTSIDNLMYESAYFIADNTGADFTPLQYAQTTPTNAVGEIIRISGEDGIIAPTVFGTGYLEAPNTRLNLIAHISNQGEALRETGQGFEYKDDRGINSSFRVNDINIVQNIYTTLVGETAATYSLTTQIQGENNESFGLQTYGRFRWGPGSSGYDVSFERLGNDLLGTNSTCSLRAGGGAWDGGHLKLGGYALWVDATGDLRIKSSAPTSDLDGVVVGSQT